MARFLASSSERSAAVRRRRPELARRSSQWCLLGGGSWIAGAALGVEPMRRRAGSGLAWWAASSLMLRWHLGMFETADGRPRDLGPADGLTLLRAWLVPVAADSPTVLVCAVGAATDVLDGALARLGEPTRAGRDLEGLVDTCFSLAVLGGLRRDRRLGRAAALAEAGRLLGGVAVSSYVYFGHARAPDARLIHAARSATVLRLAGVLAAAARRRRLGEVLVISGAAGSTALAALVARGCPGERPSTQRR